MLIFQKKLAPQKQQSNIDSKLQSKLVQLRSNIKKQSGKNLPDLHIAQAERILAGIALGDPVSQDVLKNTLLVNTVLPSQFQAQVFFEIPLEVAFSVQTIEKSTLFNFRTQRGILHYHLPKEFTAQLSSRAGTPILKIICLEKDKILIFYQHVQAMYQALVGVARGYKKKIKIVGVGYKAFLEKNHKLRITLGYSHQNYCNLDPTVRPKFSRKNNRLHLLGASLPLVTGIAASLHHLKKPDVYKGKGMRYRGVKLLKKEGKKKK